MTVIPTHPLSAAVHYAQQGWPVFPCDTQKRPLTQHGYQNATTDTDQVRAWWVDNPDAAIGIATGRISGLLVVDVDSYKPGGSDAWAELVREHADTPETFTVTTGQGGTQLYYRMPDIPLRSRVNFRTNVDIRADGGYIIAPPSRTIYGQYEVTGDTGIADCPPWLAELLQRTTEVAHRLDSTPVDLTKLSDHERARLKSYTNTVVDGEIGRLRMMRAAATPNGHGYRGEPWDQTTFEVACNLVELANAPWCELTEGDVYGLLLAEAPRDAGFDDRNVLAKWDSARKTVGETGRPLPLTPTQGGYFTPATGPGGIIDPDAFFTRGTGLNALLLAQAVLDMGPLAVEDNQDRSPWAYARGVWRPTPNEITDRCVTILGARFRTNHVTTITPAIQARCVAEGSVIRSEPHRDYINTRSGMVHWATGHLYEHRPDYYSTVQLPVDWQPDAVCPRFDRFVTQVMAPDAVSYLWEILGYMVLSGNPLQKAVLFHGDGGNGKGTLINVLRSLLGSANCSEVTLQDITEGKFEVAELYGKIANLAGDIDAAYMKSTAKFKAITGEDTVQIQRKFQTPFGFKCWATPLFSANEFWKSADVTKGYKRRWLLVSFPNYFDIQPGVAESFGDELCGILAHAVRSLRNLIGRGEFLLPESAVAERADFERTADLVAEWLQEDELLLVADPRNAGASMPTSKAYQTFVSWCGSTGNIVLPKQRWRQRMLSLGYTIRRSGVDMFVGLQVQDRQRATPWLT
jgi:putative DNA primase/helicase